MPAPLAALGGVLAGTAARFALGTAARAVVGGGARAAAGFARTGGRGAARASRSRGLRRLARRRMARRRAAGQTIAQGRGRARTFKSNLTRISSQPRRSGFGGGGGGSFNQAMQPQQVQFSSAGSGGVDEGSAQQAISQFSNRLTAAASVLGGFGAAVGLAATAVKALHGFASVLVDSQRGTAKYSGSMSAAAAGLEVGRIGREMSQAQGTAGSFVKLTNALDKLERAMQPFREAFTNVLNTVTTSLIEAVVPLVDAAKPLLTLLKDGIEFGKDAWFLWQSGGNQAGADNLRKAYDQKEWLEQLKRDKQATQNLRDLLNLRAANAVANGVNKPNPNIPNQPAKGGRGGGAPAGNNPPVFIPPGGVKI